MECFVFLLIFSQSIFANQDDWSYGDRVRLIYKVQTIKAEIDGIGHLSIPLEPLKNHFISVRSLRFRRYRKLQCNLQR